MHIFPNFFSKKSLFDDNPLKRPTLSPFGERGGFGEDFVFLVPYDVPQIVPTICPIVLLLQPLYAHAKRKD